MSESITFPATVCRIKTLIDGGIRIELDLPETEIMAAAQLMECKRAGATLNVVASLINKSNKSAKKGNDKQSKWTTTQEPSADGDTQQGA